MNSSSSTMTQVVDYNQIVELENRYRLRGTITNNYLMKEQYEFLISGGQLRVIANDKNCFFFEQKEACCRMYYFINDFNELLNTDELHEVVVEILFRKTVPENEVDYLTKCGFIVNLQRDLLFANYEDLNLTTIPENLRIRYANNIKEVEIACDYFNSIFDQYSGDYIPQSDYMSILEHNQLLVAYSNEDRFLGAFHISEEKNVNWGSHIAVFPDARGNGVGVALFNEFIKLKNKGPKTRYMHWVQHQNEIAVHMYLKMGYKYMNKSTISLIKK